MANFASQPVPPTSTPAAPDPFISAPVSRSARAAEYALILAGAAITAAALDAFLIPNRIAAGGASGLATVIHFLAGWPVGLVTLAINVPLFWACWLRFGRRFGLKTLVGTAATSACIDLFAPMVRPLTHDPMLAAIYGGMIAGVGVGLTFRAGGSTGGTDMAAMLIHRSLGLSSGQAVLLADGAVIALAGFTFNLELALYALAAVFVTTKAIDLAQEGRTFAKGAFVISTKIEAIARAVLHDLDRGATALTGRGMYTGDDRPVLFVVVSRAEVPALKRLVRRIDPQAFVVITDVSDVLGEGFRRWSPLPEGIEEPEHERGAVAGRGRQWRRTALGLIVLAGTLLLLTSPVYAEAVARHSLTDSSNSSLITITVSASSFTGRWRILR